MKYTIEMNQDEFDRYQKLVKVFEGVDSLMLEDVNGLHLNIHHKNHQFVDVEIQYKEKVKGRVELQVRPFDEHPFL